MRKRSQTLEAALRKMAAERSVTNEEKKGRKEEGKKRKNFPRIACKNKRKREEKDVLGLAEKSWVRTVEKRLFRPRPRRKQKASKVRTMMLHTEKPGPSNN